MAARGHPGLPPVRQCALQCALLGLSRSSLSHRPAPADPTELALMGLIDRQYLRTPSCGSRRMAARPRGQGATR